MRSERTGPDCRSCTADVGYFRGQSYRQMEKDRIRKIVLSPLYSNEGERRINSGLVTVLGAHSWIGYELPRVYLYLSSSEGPAEIRHGRRVHPLR